MVVNKVQKIDDGELRRRAEKRLAEGGGMAYPYGQAEEPLRLIHELQVHQIELEMQNAELRQTRGEVETTLEKFTDLYDFAPVGYVSLDRKGTIRAANLTCSALVGVERSRLIGRCFAHFVSNASRSDFADFLEKVFTSQAKETCEVALLKQGNPDLFVQIDGLAVASDEECRIAVIDNSERKRALEALRLANEKAEVLRLANETAEELRLAKEAALELRLSKESCEANAMAKSLFFANISHELRTPMTGILGMLQIALREDLAPAPREFVETALSSSRSLLRILNDILDMSKIEAGKLTIEEKPFSLQECLTEAVDLISPEVRRKGLDLTVSLAEAIPKTVIGDHARLRQVILNLIGNAVKFTEVGKVLVQVTAEATSNEGKQQMTFSVTDTGIGIPDDKQGLLFQTFSQVDGSHTRTHGGTGLGLAICREIVELMGGTINCESEEGVGSTFSFTVPLGEASVEGIALATPEPPVIEPMTGSDGKRIPRILLVEDEPHSRKALGLLLQWANFSLDFAEDGLKAVEMWEKGDYDLVLMDIQMPYLNGFEATLAIRKKERECGTLRTTIVAMTAHAFKEDEEMCLAGGMDYYISKPVDINSCIQLIRRIIKQNSCGASC